MLIFPFGKHKGKTSIDIYAIDPSYLYWFISQDWANEKFPLLCSDVKNILTPSVGTNAIAKPLVMNSGIKAIISRIEEALCHRGFTQGEANVMVSKLLEYEVKNKNQ